MKTLTQLFTIAIFLAFASCGKGFLDVKQSKSQVVPSTIADFQGILDNWQQMNISSSHELSVIGADEFYISDNHWNLLTLPYQKNGYIWADDVYEGREADDWNAAYHRILLANLALEGVGKITPAPNDQEAWDNVRGSALFFRAWNHYQLAQLFCRPYDPHTATADLGIPLRLESDVEVKVGRGSVQGTYQQVIGDLMEASELLPVLAENNMRPSKPAAYALLARVFLMMGNYTRAGEYADLCLGLKGGLVDFNALNLAANDLFPFDFGVTNPEMLFFCFMDNINITNTSRFHADTTLLAMYSSGDLRARGYFRDMGGGRKIFKGSYRGGAAFFTGLATDEIYLIRAESAARRGDVDAALHDLNTLLRHRWDPVDFQEVSGLGAEQVLSAIIEERKRELILRGIRWEDLRRLNREPRFATTLARVVEGRRFELPPDSPKYTWPIPDNEVDIAGLTQNER